MISRDLLAPRARRLFPSGCRGIQIYQEAGTEVILKDKRDRSIGSAVNHKQTHPSLDVIPYCAT